MAFGLFCLAYGIPNFVCILWYISMNKIECSIMRLREFEPPEGYYLAFSGGKDSVVILRLAQMAGVKFDAHYNNTSVDPPELVHFIREQHPGVIEEPYKKSMWDLIPEKRMPPTRLVRYCCEALKEKGGTQRIVATGIRAAESAKRSKRKMVEVCYKDTSKRYLHPIFDWTHVDVWDFIRSENIPYCNLYNEGFERLGCIGCPMAGKKRIKEFARWPTYKTAYIRAFQKMVDVRKKRGMNCQWNTGEQVFRWWMEDFESEHQIMMFD